MHKRGAVQILIGGDICPVGRIGKISGAAVTHTTTFGGLLSEMQAAGLVMANLECPLTDDLTPAKKTGPVLSSSPRCLAGLKRANIGLLGLANNHIMDHGPRSLLDTIRACAEAGIDTVGAGADRTDARRPWFATVGALRVGVLAMAEAEYSLAGPDRPARTPWTP